MRKTILAALLGTAILAGCAKETMLESTIQDVKATQPISVDITVASPGDEVDTKAAKTSWAVGDRINIWYDTNKQQESPDLVLKYNGSKWVVDAAVTVSGNSPAASGSLYAIYIGGNPNLSDWSKSYYRLREWFAAPHETDNPCTPMEVHTGACDYTYSSNTLKSKLSGWSFLTQFKVLIKDPDGEMTSSAGSYTLKVVNTTQSKTAYSVSGFYRHNSGFGCGSSDLYPAAGVKESDGIAFYFEDFSVASTDKVTFTLSEENWPDRTITKTGKTLTTSSSACTGISMNYHGFSIASGETDLTASGYANCFIVSKAGRYTFKASKGNSGTIVSGLKSAEVLWESYGTDTAPTKGDLVKDLYVSNGVTIKFTASGRKGNAVIAAKDASGNIIWSWHIWMTDQPEDQVYSNNAGTMMDRNLGATSATKGDVGALGLLYQWGRKDPFLGGSSISSNTKSAASTISWPSAVASNDTNGTIAYATANPTTFIYSNTSNYDWYYTGISSTDHTRWQSSKTIYDPCPAGYRVPDGGSTGVWSKAFGTSNDWTTSSNWDSTNKGMDFGSTDKKLGTGTIWHPASGYISDNSGRLQDVGYYGYYWSCTPWGSHSADNLVFTSDGNVYPSYACSHALGQSVRCCKE